MLKQTLFAAIAFTASAPAFAGEYFIVRGDDDDDKECRIVEARPTEPSIVVIGDRAYLTRDEAERELALVCTDDDD